MSETETHPAADEFPMMDAKRHAELTEDIRTNGQRETIKLFQGKVLDGRNRMKACSELGITPKTTTLPDDTDPWSYVWSLNGTRRDLVEEQRYLIWKHCHEQSDAWQAHQQSIKDTANAKRAEAMQGVPYAPKGKQRKADDVFRCPTCDEEYKEGAFCPHCQRPVEKVVQQNVVVPSADHRKGQSAKAEASKTNLGAVARGDKLAKQRPDLAAAVRKGELKPAEAHRQMKKAEVMGKARELPKGQYRVLYADPPWHYGDGRTGDLMTATGAQHHYPTMKLSELKALDIPSMCAPDAVLFLWATSPLLPDALELVAAWGFKYKASFVWDKVKHNMGHYNSVRHEFLFICTKGSCIPDNVKLFDSVQSIERTKHSAKPEAFRDIINTLYTEGSKIELFRRGDAPEGWEVWGNESVT